MQIAAVVVGILAGDPVGFFLGEKFDTLDDECEQIISMLSSMEKNASKFCFK